MNSSEPYKATKLWNEIIRTFRTSMPVGRHRRGVRGYDNCFVASDAVQWLQLHLRKNPNFGNDVSRQQVVQLLVKFHKSGVFRDARGPKHDAETFDDNGRLFRFSLVETTLSPMSHRMRSFRSARHPASRLLSLSSEDCSRRGKRTADISVQDASRSVQNASISVQDTNRSVQDTSRSANGVRSVPNSDLTFVWLDMTLTRLRELLQIRTVDELVDARQLVAEHVRHNATRVSPSGLVTDVGRSHQLPCWVINAMRCLAQWPQAPSNLPRYAGFELDVFAAVAEYFASDTEPLVPTHMYDMLVSILVLADNLAVGELPQAQSQQKITASCADMLRQMRTNCGGVQWNNSCTIGWSVGHNRVRGCQSDCDDDRRTTGRIRRCKSEAEEDMDAGIHTIDNDSLLISCLQLACLLLPPARRRRLHLLLRLMNKITHNDSLKLDSILPTHDVVLQTFAACIMRKQDRPQPVSRSVSHNATGGSCSVSDNATGGSASGSVGGVSIASADIFAVQVVAFMTANYTAVMRVPSDLKEAVETRIAAMSTLRQDRLRNCDVVDCDRRRLTGRGIGGSSASSLVVDAVRQSGRVRKQFCSQIPAEQFSLAGRLSSEQALLDLLEGILGDENLSPRDKRRRLRTFKESHPHVYSARFPDAEVEKSVMDGLRDRKGVFSRTLSVLRNWKL